MRERDQEPGVIRHGLKAMAIFLYLAMMMPGIAGSCLADNRPRPDNVPSDQVTAPGTSTPSTGTSSILMEEFHDLSAWEELNFPKISQHSSYTIEADTSFTHQPGQDREKNLVLRAKSDASASAILWKGEFNVYEYPRLRWRWKVENCYKKGDASMKKGDDYPLRLYVMFKYVPSDPAVRKSLKHGLANLFYGRTPPYTTLNYIWANRDHGKMIMPNPYSESAMMILLQAGEGRAGQWIHEDIDIVEDYKKAFGTPPPAIAGLAIMNDSDDTGESSVSWVDDIEIYGLEREP